MLKRVAGAVLFAAGAAVIWVISRLDDRAEYGEDPDDDETVEMEPWWLTDEEESEDA